MYARLLLYVYKGKRVITEYLENYVGDIDYEWSLAEQKYNNIRCVKIPNQPFENLTTYSTVGLSDYPLQMNDRFVCQELLFSVYSSYSPKDVASFLLAFAEYLIDMKEGLLRGEVTGPNDPIFPFTAMNAVYASLPAFFEGDFHVLEADSKAVVFVWLIPLYESEAQYIQKEGWEDFETLLESAECEFWNLNREALPISV